MYIQWYNMDFRAVSAEEITSAVKKLFMDCNYFIGADILCALEKARDNEKSPVGKSVLSQIIENDRIAAEEEIPLCQDTGMAVLFIEYGDKVCVDGDFEEAVTEGVRRAYRDGYLRKSVVSDPVGDKIHITAGGKGFGSENMSAIKMLTPSYGVEGVKKFILDTVFAAGPNPCPPIVVGVGIGGTFERAAQLAKKATFRAIDTSNPDPRYAALENELLSEINKMGFGPAGLGGNTTALGVNIETSPTHIAGMPVAVNICCHAARHASVEI